MLKTHSRRAATRAEKDLTKRLDRRDAELSRLNNEVADLKQQLEAERVTVRIQQVEIDKLAAVCARDLERVRAESAVKEPENAS